MCRVRRTELVHWGPQFGIVDGYGWRGGCGRYAGSRPDAECGQQRPTISSSAQPGLVEITHLPVGGLRLRSPGWEPLPGLLVVGGGGGLLMGQIF